MGRLPIGSVPRKQVSLLKKARAEIMSDDKEPPSTDQQKTSTTDIPSGKRRRPYSSPRLETYGDIRTLTTGGSPGIGDSGSATTRRPLPF